MGKGSVALREAGYVPLPRWWVTPEQLEMIQWMARQNLPEISKIRHKALGTYDDEAWKNHWESKDE